MQTKDKQLSTTGSWRALYIRQDASAMLKETMKLLSPRKARENIAAARETLHERSTASQWQASWHDMPPHEMLAASQRQAMK